MRASTPTSGPAIRAPGTARMPPRQGVRDAAADRLVEEVPEPATDAELTRVHDAGYIALLTEAEARGGGWLDPDTFLVPDRCSRRGSRPVQRCGRPGRRSRERRWSRSLRSARPATTRDVTGERLLPLQQRRGRPRRAAGRRCGAACVAIVDWDVHHGDGTQAIVQGDRALYASTHQYPFYPHRQPTTAEASRGISPCSATATMRSSRHGATSPARRRGLRPEAILVSAATRTPRIRWPSWR